MTENNPERVSAITNILQLIVLVIGVGGIFFTLGSRDETVRTSVNEISELKDISSDLVKAQVMSQAKDGEQDRMLADILRRLAIIESDK